MGRRSACRPRWPPRRRLLPSGMGTGGRPVATGAARVTELTLGTLAALRFEAPHAARRRGAGPPTVVVVADEGGRARPRVPHHDRRHDLHGRRRDARKNQTCVASLGSQRNGRPSNAAAAATSEGFDRRRRRPPVDDGACTAVAS